MTRANNNRTSVPPLVAMTGIRSVTPHGTYALTNRCSCTDLFGEGHTETTFRIGTSQKQYAPTALLYVTQYAPTRMLLGEREEESRTVNTRAWLCQSRLKNEARACKAHPTYTKNNTCQR